MSQWTDTIRKLLNDNEQATQKRTQNAKRTLQVEQLEVREVPATITVTSLADNTTAGDSEVTLREAIMAAETDTSVDGSTQGSGPDIIVFEAGLTGTIPLSVVGDGTFGPSAFAITTPIIIDGLNGAAGITLEPTSTMRLFAVNGESASLTLRGLTLSGGVARGGDGDNGENVAGGGGGGAGLGGAIYNAGGELIVNQCTLTGNSAVGGDGGDAGTQPASGGGKGSSPPPPPDIGGAGGGLGGSGSSTATSSIGGGPNGAVNDAGTITAEAGFGGGAAGSGGTVGSGKGATATPASVAGFGGGGGAGTMAAPQGSDGGFGAGGGGGYTTGGGKGGTPAEGFGVSAFGGGDGQLAGGGGAGLGGAIFNDGGTVDVQQSTFANNTAEGGAGGAGTEVTVGAPKGSSDPPTTTIEGAGVAGQGLGGAVFNRSGTVTLTSVTVAGNTADTSGGGVYAMTGSTTNLTSTIVGDNTADLAPDFDGTVEANFSLIEDPTQTTLSGTSSNNITIQDPELGLLSNNGGPTQTFLLLAGSPALDTGSNPLAMLTDQRGFVREVNGAVDIGAVEVDSTPPETTIDSSPSDPTNDSTPSFTFSGTDNGAVDHFEVQIDSGGWTTQTSPFTTGVLSEGSHTFEVRAIDQSGNVDATPASYTFVVNGPPTLDDPGSQSVDEGSLLSFSLVGDDVPGDVLTYTIESGFQTGMILDSSTGAFSWTPPDDGSFDVTFRVTDQGGLFAEQTITISVANIPPTLGISGNASVDEGDTYTLNLSASDPGTDTISQWDINWGDGSPVQTVSGNPASVTHVYADNGSYTISATATDEDGTFAAGNTVSVIVNNVAPMATGVAGPTFLGLSQVGNFSLADVFDPSSVDTGSLRYSFATSLGSLAADYDTASTATSFNFSSPTLGTYTIYGRVFDKDGTSNTYSTTVTVNGGTKFDMKASVSAPAVEGWRKAWQGTKYNATTGYGWSQTSSVGGGANGVVPSGENKSVMGDYAYGQVAATFQVFVGAFQSATVNIYSYGTASQGKPGVAAKIGNGPTSTLNTNGVLTISGTAGADGILNITFNRVTGKAMWIVSAIEVNAGGPV